MTAFDFKKEVPEICPVLNAGQIAKIAEVAERKTYADGEVLIRVGDRDSMFTVIKSGAIDIVDRSSGEPQTLLTHGAGEFTGDFPHFTGKTSIIDAVARGTTEVYEVRVSDLQRIISEQPDLSDLILRTFSTLR